MTLSDQTASSVFASSIARYHNGEWRALIARDLIAADIRNKASGCTVLDIGCGRGFDDDLGLQMSLAALAQTYIGVEPDPNVKLGSHIHHSYRCLFEQAPIEDRSVDVAFCVMVLEHLSEPAMFWDKLYAILKPGGTFWGLTVDRRSLFARLSLVSERLHLKELYMRWLLGERGEGRYLNYSVYYKSNTPRDLSHFAGRFASCEVANFSRVGQSRPAVPGVLHPLTDLIDRCIVNQGWPGSLLAVRVVK